MSSQPATHENAIFRGIVIAAMILFAAIIRIVPHPWNLAPVGAMALFSGAAIRNRWVAFLFPLLALLAGDFFVGFHVLMPVVYASFLISVAIGFWLRDNRKVLRLGGAVVLGAAQFFLITNFGVWLFLQPIQKRSPGWQPVTLQDCLCFGIRLPATRSFRWRSLDLCIWRNRFIRWERIGTRLSRVGIRG